MGPSERLPRREFLRLSLLATASVALDPLDLRALGPRTDPPGRRSDPLRVVIVGAGAAGLAAAGELVAGGHDVVVLEARTRPGGRIRTLREPFGHGLHAEAGAARIPDSHELTHRYVKAHDLELEPFDPTLPSLLLHGGERLRNDDPRLLARFGFPDEEQALGLGGLLALFEPLVEEMGDMAAPGWPSASILRRFDRQSGEELMRGLGLSDAAIEFFDLGFGVVRQMSGLELLVSLTAVQSRKTRIRGGMDRLPAAMAVGLGDRVRYGAPVRTIRLQGDGAIVTVGGAAGPRTLRADRVLCTLPPAVLAAEDGLLPDLSAAKQSALSTTPTESVTRVYVQTRTRYWLRHGLSGFGLTDDHAELWDASDGQPGEAGLLMYYTRDEFARDLAARTPEERARWAYETTRVLLPGTEDEYAGAYSWVWADDPWARGAYTAWRRGDMTRCYHELRRPEGAVHFAGEHTSPWPGWIQGALHSGIRAAMEIQDAAGPGRSADGPGESEAA